MKDLDFLEARVWRISLFLIYLLIIIQFLINSYNKFNKLRGQNHYDCWMQF